MAGLRFFDDWRFWLAVGIPIGLAIGLVVSVVDVRPATVELSIVFTVVMGGLLLRDISKLDATRHRRLAFGGVILLGGTAVFLAALVSGGDLITSGDLVEPWAGALTVSIPVLFGLIVGLSRFPRD